jgi:Transglutaminase-like superfamily
MKNQDSSSQSPTYRISADVCFSIDNDGTIILNVEAGKFHSLIQGGSKVWSVLAAHPQGMTEPELITQLADEDELASEPREKVEAAVKHTLQQLTRGGLIETKQSKHRSTLQTLNSRVCISLATAVRHAGNTLIRFRSVQAAAFIQFAFYEAIRKFGGFYARQQILRTWPIADKSRQIEPSDLPALCEAVHRAAVWYPKQTLCLQKASVTTGLLRQHGFHADMKIGIRKQPFHAHAWVEVDGQVVGDHQNVRNYFREIASW